MIGLDLAEASETGATAHGIETFAAVVLTWLVSGSKPQPASYCKHSRHRALILHSCSFCLGKGVSAAGCSPSTGLGFGSLERGIFWESSAMECRQSKDWCGSSKEAGQVSQARSTS